MASLSPGQRVGTAERPDVEGVEAFLECPIFDVTAKVPLITENASFTAFLGQTSDRPNGLRQRANPHTVRHTAPRHFARRGPGFRQGNSGRSRRREADSSLLTTSRSTTDRRIGGTSSNRGKRGILRR